MDVSELAAGVEPATSLSSLALPNSSADLAKSPSSSEFLVGDEEARSTCPLLTPSPPAVTNEQYTPENEINFPINGDTTDDITHFQSPLEGFTGAKFNAARQSMQSEVSDSSGSSGREPTACVQLLGPHHHYQHVYMTNSTENNSEFQENGGAVNMPLSFDHYSSVGDYFFTTWNWPLIRQLSSFFVVAALIGAFGVAITMIVTLPKACDPEHTWWSSATVYEIFPASFKDSKYQDGMGDLSGVGSPESISYLRSLGVGAVRLNSIFASQNYPEDYYNATSLTEVDRKLGSVEDVRTLAKKLHANNISLILDLPVHIVKYNNSPEYIDPVVNALEFWSSYEVDGFFFVGLDNESVQPYLIERLQNWREAMARRTTLFIAPPIMGVENYVDLVHVSLDLSHGGPLRPSITSALELWSQKILWSVGHSGNLRLADRLKNNNNTVAVLMLLMSLPGTPSILYGDEIGLKGLHDPNNDHGELQHLRQLPPMPWAYSNLYKFSDHNILPWMPSGEALLKNTDALQAQAAIAKMAVLRKYSPQMYMTNRTIGEEKGSKNFGIKYEDKETGVIAVQRWYQRRHKIVTVANLGMSAAYADLSPYYYGGRVIISYPHTHLQGLDIKMRDLMLQAGEVLVMQVDK